MTPLDQLTLPGFATIKRIRQRHGHLQLLEFDVAQWRQHQADLDQRGAALPKIPRARDAAARQEWKQKARELLSQPLPTIKPIRIWELGRYSGAPVLPWLKGKREPLTAEQIEELKAVLRQRENPQ